MRAFAQALARGPGVISVARSGRSAFSGSDGDLLSVQKPGDPQTFSPTSLAVTPDYFQLYGIKILAGRIFSAARAEDVSPMRTADRTWANGEERGP